VVNSQGVRGVASFDEVPLGDQHLTKILQETLHDVPWDEI
jgi:hypothetical protein